MNKIDVSDHLEIYKSKRNFSLTPEPAEAGTASENLQFVVQKHWASSLHYDFRLELNGVMKSWAIPKGPSYDPTVKRMAVHVEDHPISYANFEGTIPAKQYGAGKVIVWDKGNWRPMGDPNLDYQKGNLKFELMGLKLLGKWVLIRMKGKGEKQEPWLLIKEKDALAKSTENFSVVDEYPDSVSDQPFPKNTSSSNTVFKTDLDESIEDILKEAIKAELPSIIKPQLATLVERAFVNGTKWIVEIKFDGYRILTRIKNKEIKFFTRNGNDWTSKLLFIKQEITKLNLPAGWYDGEIIVPNAKGIPDFGALQQSFEMNKCENIVMYLFDIIYFKGYDLREIALRKRRAILTNVFEKVDSKHIHISEIFAVNPESLLKSACQLGLEGIILKNPNSRYICSRSSDWLKLKCKQRQEFVVVGYTPPNGLRSAFGALLLGIYDEKGDLIHAGNVGAGFNQKTLSDIKQILESIVITKSALTHPYTAPPKTTWVKPILIIEVEFGEWTASDHIRHSVFKGLRMDKDPKTIVREKPKDYFPIDASLTQQPIKKLLKKPHNKPRVMAITHPDRVVDPSSNITKLEIVRYYQLIGDLMMPHLKHRPVSLLRAPSGLAGELFFQKHAETEKLLGVEKVEQLDNKQPLIEITNKEGLASAAQWNGIEFHTHNGNLSLDLPNRMIFDLDPGEHVQWAQVQEAAQLMHAFLKQLNLPAFLKTSGGKGLHVVVPTLEKLDWDTVKAFTEAIVVHMRKTIPSRFVAKSGPKNRVGKIFIDYLRNAQDATTVCAWSLRARTGMGISVPVDWNELGALKSGDHWTLRNAHTRLDKGNEPWKTYEKSAVDITDAISLLKA